MRTELIALMVGALVVAATTLAPQATLAKTTSERPASILIFPKVVSDGTRDTFIQISNTANSVVHAHCFYVNAYPICQGIGDCQQGTCSGPCIPQWQEIDFNITLTKQQPAHWGAGLGRIAQSADPCSFNTDSKERNYDCYCSGLDDARSHSAGGVSPSRASCAVSRSTNRARRSAATISRAKRP